MKLLATMRQFLGVMSVTTIYSLFTILPLFSPGFLQHLPSNEPRKATKVEGQRGKSLDFPGASTKTHQDPQQTPGQNSSAASNDRSRWVPSYSRSSAIRDGNEVVFRRVRG